MSREASRSPITAPGTGSRSPTVADRAAAASPQDQHAQLRLIQTYEGLGRCYAALGADRMVPRGEQLSRRRAACEWRQEALALWVDWTSHVKASDFGKSRREQAARAVAG